MEIRALVRSNHQHILVEFLAGLDNVVLRCLSELVPNLLAYLWYQDIIDHDLQCAQNVLTVELAFFVCLVRVTEVVDE